MEGKIFTGYLSIFNVLNHFCYIQRNVSEIFDVTDQLERIYGKLAQPLQDLENKWCSDELPVTLDFA